MNSYPQIAGYKARETSRAAAELIEKTRAPNLRQRVLAWYMTNNGTADECAAGLGLSVLSIRPRVSELGAQGKLQDTGARRKNSSGHTAIVWKLAN